MSRLVIDWLKKEDLGEVRSENFHGYDSPVMVPGIGAASSLSPFEARVFNLMLSRMATRSNVDGPRAGYLMLETPSIILHMMNDIEELANKLGIDYENLIGEGNLPASITA